MAQCKAKSKATGERCKRAAVAGRAVCYIHGGATPRGRASPHFKHGRYAKDAPARIRERYEAGLRDRELMTLQHEIALIDSRTQELLAALNGAAIGEMWLLLRSAYDAMLKASKTQNFGEGQKAFEEIGQIITQGANDFEAWMQIGALVEQRRKLVDTEYKRLVAAGQVMTVEEAMVLVSTLQDIIQARLAEYPDILQLIETDLVRVVNRPPRTEPLRAGDGDDND